MLANSLVGAGRSDFAAVSQALNCSVAHDADRDRHEGVVLMPHSSEHWP
jgi:hypothetical protein